ncbi:MAG: ATP-binding protein [Paludibacter sp.]|nr:ATP-binding protein [Paludibacter sp.]
MDNWIDTALQLLHKSLRPIPQELNELDWKSGLSDKSERLAQHISAFANYPNGGYLAYGIGNDGSSKSLSKEEMDSIVQKLGNIARNNLAQPIGIEHAVTEFNGQPVLIIKIPEYQDKPVHLRGSDIYNSYKRSAGQTVKLSRTELKQLIASSTGIDFESQIAASNVNEDEVLKLLDYDSYFTLQEKRLPDTKLSILQTLASEDLIKKSSSFWSVFNLGAVLFAKDIMSFKELKRKAVRVIVYKETSRINALKEQEGGRGYASGFEGLVNYIMDQLPSNEVIENAIRKNVKVYPEVAIREFVANALIHQDFSVSGSGVMIEIFSDRIEITNPGVPLVDVNRFIDTAPKSRNESLASLMRRLNICEERGSGIDRAISAIEVFQLPAPKFIRGDDYTRVIMFAPTALTRMTIEDKVRACYQHTCLYYVNNHTVNNQSVRKRFKIGVNNVSMASKIISETIEAGLIKASDPENSSKKFASYIPYWA